MRKIDISTAIDNSLKSEKTYWENKFDGFSEYAMFDTGDKSGNKEDHEIYSWTIGEDIGKKLIKVSKENDHQLHVILLSALYLLLQKYSQEKDLLIFTPVFNMDTDTQLINNVLALRLYMKGDMTFKDLVIKTKKTIIEANKNQNYPYELILEEKKILGNLDAVVLLENIQDTTRIDEVDFNLKFAFRRKEQELRLNLKYDKNKYLNSTIKRMVGLFEASLVVGMESNGDLLSELSLNTKEEKDFLLSSSLGEQIDYVFPHVVNQLMVHANSQHKAVIEGGKSWTYKEVHEKSGQLASHLRSIGVKNNTVVAITMKPSVYFVISVLAVLKSGGCFMPIDPAMPRSRKRFMISDSKAEVMIMSAKGIDEIQDTLLEIPSEKILDISNEEAFAHECIDISSIGMPISDFAYIIYTSGSTGDPKGVLINHQSLNNYISWAADEYIKQEKVSMPLFTSIAFDLTITSLFLPLVSGGTLHMYPSNEREIILDKILEEDQVNLIKLTPSHLKIIKEKERIPNRLKTLIVGGELLETAIASDIHSQGEKRLEIYNEYGPTEATVGCSIYKFSLNQKYGKSVLIGKPAPNCQLLVLDDTLNPVPFGLEGEIYIGGTQVGSGYTSKQITEERFVENPFHEGTMYKTGDVGKVYEDGNIEYVRRIDNQIKLNGYRIELGEIEMKLMQFHRVTQSKVVFHKNISGRSYLGAYYSSKDSISNDELKKHLLEFLPAYMIPLYFMRLDKFPLTLNGKLDEKGLPKFESAIQSGAVLPKNEKEQLLVEIMTSVLGVEVVGMTDNFFEKGGDSIKIIQMAARLLKHGYKLNIRDIYDHPVAAELVRFMIPSSAVIEQGLIEGETILNPIQRWFYESYHIREHYNQSVMLHCVNEMEVSTIETIFNKLVQQHDALRMTLGGDEEHPILINRKVVSQEDLVKFIDLRSAENEFELLEDHANDLQSSISLKDGPLIKVGLFKLKDGDRLLIVAHHLVIDGVSWRILLDDFTTIYQQFIESKKIELPPKTHSFLEWNNALEEYANVDENIEKELGYWKSLNVDGIEKIPHDIETEECTLAHRGSFSFSLPVSHTNDLLRTINWVYRTEINDVLMAGLILSVQTVFNLDKLAINLEGHGREDILGDIEVSRTVGWFTSLFPVILDVSACEKLPEKIKTIKEQLHSIPSKGVGYGIIKYLSTLNEHAVCQTEPSISFNYLGSFEDTVENEFFKIAKEKAGNSISPMNTMVHDIDIQGNHIDGQIHITVLYSEKRFRRETIEKLGNAYQSALVEIIEHCKQCSISQPTPSDFTFNDLSIDQIDSLYSQYTPEDIYPLTPMQKGLYFHAVSNPDSFAYNTQFGFTIKGNLGVERMKECFNHLLVRYQNLRANFFIGNNTSPVQLITKNKEIEFYHEDLSTREDKTEYLAIAEEKLLKKAYDFVNDVLMRVAIYKTDENEYKVLWYYHHILIDGWCLNILFKDILTIYSQLLNNQEIDLPVVYPYKNYITWIQNTNHDKSREYWGNYLNGFREPSTLLGTVEPCDFEEKSDASVYCRIGIETVSQLEKIASKEGCTMYTMIEAIWSILLSKSSDKNDIIYGQVVSGRPNIEGSSEMVGLFINTIPKRVVIDEEVSFVNLLKQILQDDIESLEHQTYPLSDLMKTTSLGRDLFDHVIVFENQYQLMEVGSEMSSIDFDVIETESYDPNEYNLSIFIHHNDGQLSFEIRFNEERYLKDDIEQVSKSLQTIAKTIAEDQNQSINDILLTLIDEELDLTQVNFMI